MPIPMAPSMAPGPASSRSTATARTSRGNWWGSPPGLHATPWSRSRWPSRSSSIVCLQLRRTVGQPIQAADPLSSGRRAGLPAPQLLSILTGDRTLIRRPARHQRPLPNLQTSPPRRQHLTRVEPPLRVEQSLQAPHHVQRVRRELLAHQLVLFHAYAVLAGDRSARFHAVLENLFTRGARPFQLARLARVE